MKLTFEIKFANETANSNGNNWPIYYQNSILIVKQQARPYQRSHAEFSGGTRSNVCGMDGVAPSQMVGVCL